MHIFYIHKTERKWCDREKEDERALEILLVISMTT